LADSLWASACIPNKLNIHRYSNGELLYSEQGYGQKMQEAYGSPFLDIHRADLQLALVEKAKSLGVDFRLGEKVIDVDLERSLVASESGRQFQGDLVVGADGLWSRCREIFLKKSDKPNPTGDLAYRIILNSKDIPDDDLREIVTNPSVNFWFGPGGHVVSYSVRSKDMLNIGFMYPDDLPPDVSRKESSMEEMRALFKSWDPTFVDISCC
jgi:salicylate hydroxylase